MNQISEETIIEKVCPVCSRVYQTEKVNNRRYCSVPCMRKGLVLQNQKKRNGTYKLDIRQNYQVVNDSGVDALMAGIVLQAVKDFKTALVKKDYGQIIHLKKFFVYPWGQLLSKGNGERIIVSCEKGIKGVGV